jgi:hypothetical protein
LLTGPWTDADQDELAQEIEGYWTQHKQGQGQEQEQEQEQGQEQEQEQPVLLQLPAAGKKMLPSGTALHVVACARARVCVCVCASFGTIIHFSTYSPCRRRLPRACRTRPSPQSFSIKPAVRQTLRRHRALPTHPATRVLCRG